MRLLNLNKIITLVAFAVVSLVVMAEPIVIGQAETLHSEILAEDRPLSIYLPDSYDTLSEERYPVLYVLDGEKHFKRAVGNLDWLAYGTGNAVIPEHIIVSIPNTNGSRGRDFSVNRDPEAVKKFLDFLAQELIPHIDGKFRTQPYRILNGHSATATFSLYAMMERPQLFQAYIAASPSWGEKQGLVATQALNKFEQSTSLPIFMFTTSGNELPTTIAGYNRWIEILENSAPADLDWRSQLLPTEIHMTTPGVTLHHGLRALYADLIIDPGSEIAREGLKGVNAYFQELSEGKYGYSVSAEITIRNLAFVASTAGKYETAIEYMQANIESHPDSTTNYYSLALYQERDGQLQEALGSISTAIRMAEGDPGYANLSGLRRAEERLTLAIRTQDSDK